jgi:hypothetical protein
MRLTSIPPDELAKLGEPIPADAELIPRDRDYRVQLVDATGRVIPSVVYVDTETGEVVYADPAQFRRGPDGEIAHGPFGRQTWPAPITVRRLDTIEIEADAPTVVPA